MNAKLPADSRYVVVSLNKPVIWQRTEDETWMLNPRRKYVLNACALESLGDRVESVSELTGARNYRPLSVSMLTGRPLRLLVERHRLRGLGDLLFMTGPLSFIKSVAPDSVIDYYGLSDRSELLAHHPALSNGTVLAGPITTGDFESYDAQWLVNSVTEHCGEDQVNVYDALYTSFGVDPSSVPTAFKRPSLALTKDDAKDLAGFFYHVQQATSIDLRTTDYYVVAPLCNSSLRSAPYAVWLEIIKELRQSKPVVVIGHAHQKVPHVDMSLAEFTRALDALAKGGGIVNAIASAPTRLLASVIARAKVAVTLDSGPLYIAQALRVPAVSLWGTHDPVCRLGYDQDYLANAMWTRSACPASPCWAFAGWPTERCPGGVHQSCCAPLAAVNPAAVANMVLKLT